MAEQQSLKTQMRRRLIGLAAVIVITLAIAPLLFDAAGYKERQMENRIPPAPELRPVMEVTPVRPLIEDPERTLEGRSGPQGQPLSDEIVEAVGERRPEVLPSEDPPELDTRGIPVAWSLQLASFKDEQNARSLRSDLNAAGYKVYIRHSGDLVRVFIGPEMQRTRLERLQETIKKDYALDGMIVRFTTD